MNHTKSVVLLWHTISIATFFYLISCTSELCGAKWSWRWDTVSLEQALCVEEADQYSEEGAQEIVSYLQEDVQDSFGSEYP